MKKHHTNRFYKGINSDTSFLDRMNDMLCDAQNVRITSKDKDGMFAATIRGNREEFQLSSGFVPIGATEYNGILFILSANPSKPGLGEIGTFPSPNGFGGGFTRVYSPLQNFSIANPNELIEQTCENQLDTVNRQDFRTFSLNFSCEHQARVIARIDFDKSVNIYWTDNFNPLRSVNTGFHSETGEYNGRLFSEQQVKQGYINIINENDFTPVVKAIAMGDVGTLQAGHYFFFARYTDLSFNTTSFLGMSQAVPIYNEINAQVGKLPYGLEGGLSTNRDVTLRIEKIDKESAFVEVGYVYYFGQDQFEAKLIDKRNLIKGQTSIDVNITGKEPTIPLTLDQIIAYKPSDALIAKDLGQLNNQMYIANTRGRAIDHPDLRKFFCAIEIGENSELNREVPYVEDGGPITHIYGTDYKDVHERVGYFSGETYVFAGIPIFKGGFVGAAYPMTGFDNYLGNKINPNQEGIFRFSKAQVTPYFQNSRVFVKGVSFDTTAAKQIFNDSKWLRENLIGIYFARGERIKNLLYQGMMVNNYNGEAFIENAESVFDLQSLAGISSVRIKKVNKTKHMPMVEPAFPYWSYGWAAIPGVPFVEPVYQYYPSGFFISGVGEGATKEYSVFSLDHYLDLEQGLEGVPGGVYVERVGVIQDSMWEDNPAKQRRAPVPIGVEFIDSIATITGTAGADNKDLITAKGTYPTEFVQLDIDYGVSGGFTSDSFNVPAWSENGVSQNSRQFVSRVREGDPINQGMFYIEEQREATMRDEYLMSLPVSTPSYILLSNNSDESLQFIENWRNHIVNVHRINPNDLDYEKTYDFKNTSFSQISDAILIKDLLDEEVRYQGDCFAARIYLKTHNHHDDEVGENFFNVISVAQLVESNPDYTQLYTDNNYGHYLSIVTENAYNPNYRYEKGANSFYPRDFDFALTKNAPESPFYNTGYKRMLGPRQFLGIDLFKPISDNQFPTRIRPSGKHILNSLQDGYLQFIAGDFKDFDYQYGPINALIMRADDFFSIQDDAINLHPINERTVSPSTGTDTPFILGESSGLTEFKRSVTIEYGSQHQWSVIRGEYGIYGFDWNKRTFWRVGGQQGFENLGLTKQCEKWIEDIVNLRNSGYSDITEQLLDNPVCREGIHSIYDREYKEINMTFILGEGINTTICFSEKLNNFMTKWSFTPTFYAELERDLYSFANGSFWLHDANDLHNTFYGVLDRAYVEIVVNPDSELAKHFDNIIVSSNNVEFSKVTYQTQHQEAIQDPFLGEFWNRAIYREFQWKLPIRRADNIRDGELSLGMVKSRMRGRYLIINLEYFQDKRMWLREIITAYTHSKA